MVAYSFQKMFAEDIRFGLKWHTVRGERKRHARPGETMQLYTGMRTKHCKRIIEDPKVEAVQPIMLGFEPPCVLIEVMIDGQRRHPSTFAALDGFRGWRFRVPAKWTGHADDRWSQGPAEAMGAFWRHNAGMFVPEWQGWIIQWQHCGVIASPEAYVEEFGTVLYHERFAWLSAYLGWAKPEGDVVNGLPPDLPDLGVAR